MSWMGSILGNAALTGTMYGAMSVVSDEGQSGHHAKYGVAAGIDLGSDLVSTGVAAAAASRIHPLAGMAVFGLDMVTDFMGLDLATASLGVMDQMDAAYDRTASTTGNNYRMSQGSAQALQRQIGNLHASGSNVAEMMHN